MPSVYLLSPDFGIDATTGRPRDTYVIIQPRGSIGTIGADERNARPNERKEPGETEP
jgi:hypothetical protein